MRIVTLFMASIIITAGLLSLASHVASARSEEVPPTITLQTDIQPVPAAPERDYGPADVFGGPDGPIKLAEDPAVNAGVCRAFGDDDNVAPHGKRHVLVCVPLYGPESTILTSPVHEDGVTVYGTPEDPQQWVWDVETGQFYSEKTGQIYGE